MPRLFYLKMFGWLVWGGTALWLCWMGPWFSPEEVAKIPAYWHLMIAWTFMTTFVLVYIIFFSRTSLSELAHDHEGQRSGAHIDFMNRRVITLSLIGGFSVALPAFAFTIIGLVVAIPHFTAGLSENEGNSVIDSFSLTPLDEEPSAYFIAVDISESNLKGSKDPKLDQVCGVVQTLFSQDRDGARIIKAEDDFRPFVFAGQREILFYSEDGNFDKDSLADKFCLELKARLNEQRTDVSSTDIVSFLDYISGWIEGERGNYKHITVMLFSDFVQDEPIEDHEKIESSIDTFMTKIRKEDGVHLVGISMRGNERREKGIDVIPYLEKYGLGQNAESRIWREIPLDRYLEGGPDARRATLLFNVYREIHHQEPLYLKYQVAPAWHGITTRLKMPDDINHKLVYVGLRSSQDGDGALSKVKIAFAENADPFILGIGGVRTPGFGAYRRQGIPLPLTLNSKLDVSRSVECDLLIAVPSLAAVHSIRLVMLPVVGNFASEALRVALRFLSLAVALFALAASGVPEVIHRWSAKRKGRNNATPA